MTEITFKWTNSTVLLLIEGHWKQRHLLDSASYKKADVYRHIASELTKVGYKVTPTECMFKMDNLLWRLYN